MSVKKFAAAVAAVLAIGSLLATGRQSAQGGPRKAPPPAALVTVTQEAANIFQTLAEFTRRQPAGEWGNEMWVSEVLSDPEFPRICKSMKRLGDLKAPIGDLRGQLLYFVDLLLEACRKNPSFTATVARSISGEVAYSNQGGLVVSGGIEWVKMTRASGHVAADIERAASAIRGALKSDFFNNRACEGAQHADLMKVARCLDEIMADIEKIGPMKHEPFMRGDWQRRFEEICRDGGAKLYTLKSGF